MTEKALYVQGRLEHHSSPFSHTHFKVSDVAFLDGRFGKMHRASLNGVERGKCFVAQKSNGANSYSLVDTDDGRVIGMVRRSRCHYPWWRIIIF
jgi:hypothetical protein